MVFGYCVGRIVFLFAFGYVKILQQKWRDAMKRNTFGDGYAETWTDVESLIEAKAMSPDEVNADVSYNADGDDDGGGNQNSKGWSAEIRDNEQGETVGYTVAFDDQAKIIAMLMDGGIARTDINII